ncbi:hypothetical protein F0U61_39680 [Archangium violaceum]|uniref:hypothetical protein n=1 Tax=Archangium violaceum TaxID=83451 RepID=UPI002B2E19F9|nr:hypothetical protein F0U61_39680 [Archangium violaceum]
MKLQKVLDAGPGNPIVARLGIGLIDLLQFTTLSEVQVEEMKNCLLGMMHRLVEAEKAARRVLAELQAIEEQVQGSGLVLQGQGRVVEVPGAMNLHDAAAFIVQAKKVLQDAIKVFHAVFGETFKGAHFHKALAWAEKTLGAAHPLTALLREDQPWIAQLIEMRNEEEHPQSGKPFIANYDVVRGDDGKLQLIPPTFFNGLPVANALKVFSHNLLTFIEELVVLSLQEKLVPTMGVAEVPEDRRDPKQPVRFVPVFRGPLRPPGSGSG